MEIWVNVEMVRLTYLAWVKGEVKWKGNWVNVENDEFDVPWVTDEMKRNEIWVNVEMMSLTYLELNGKWKEMERWVNVENDEFDVPWVTDEMK